MAALFAAHKQPVLSFFRPRATGLIARSDALLSMESSPSVIYRQSARQLFSAYSEGKIQACHSVLVVELAHILGEFVDDMAVVGGWVPSLLIPNAEEEHIGSMDVDLALNGANISEESYATINKIL